MNFYKLGKMLISTIFYPLYRIKVIGKENVPKKGPVIICSNHISNFDPPVVGITNPRTIHFMAKEELFRKKFIASILIKVKAFPIKRGMKDRNAFRHAFHILKEGKTLGLFPEGTRSKTGELGKGLTGAGFFAIRSNAKVVPCAIIGSYRPFKPLKVVYGKPINMQEYKVNKVSPKDVTEIIMAEIKTLIKKHTL